MLGCRGPGRQRPADPWQRRETAGPARRDPGRGAGAQGRRPDGGLPQRPRDALSCPHKNTVPRPRPPGATRCRH